MKQTAELREYHLRQQNITLLVQCTSEPLPVLVDREEIQQVVLNLLLNAEQAIESLSGQRNDHHPDACTLADRQIVEVLDDGPGIRPELRGRIFEPFFTTKEMGEGTGLGLSISHGIAAAHGGSLETLRQRRRRLLPSDAAGASILAGPRRFGRPRPARRRPGCSWSMTKSRSAVCWRGSWRDVATRWRKRRR